MQSKKNSHLQQFDIIQLSNTYLIYIRNPKRNKIMFVPSHLLKIYISNLSLFFIFFTLPPTGTYFVETNPSVQTMETSIGVTRC
jgi:hypothetical protein